MAGTLVSHNRTADARMTPTSEFPQPRRPLYDGMLVTLPVLIASFPFALVSGVAAAGIGLEPFTAMAPSFFLYAGASQLVLLQLLSAGSPALVIVGEVAALAARLHWFGREPLEWRRLSQAA